MLEEAEACLQRAVEIDPGHVAAHFNLGIEQWQRIAPFYNRLFYVPEASPIASRAVNPNLDTGAIERAYRENKPNLVFFDTFWGAGAHGAVVPSAQPPTPPQRPGLSGSCSRGHPISPSAPRHTSVS